MLLETTMKYYDKKYDLNCAECILVAANEEYDLNISKQTLMTMASFGGGMAIGSTCGAATGSIATLGIMFTDDRGHNSPHVREMTGKFLSEFNKDLILLKKSEIEKYKIFGNTKLSKKAKENLGEYIGIVVNDKFMVCDKINIEDCLNTKGNHSGLTKKETTIPLIVI